MNDEEFHDQVIERMNVLIQLLLDGSPTGEHVSTAARIERLLGLGLSPAAVAKVMGRSTNYVTATSSRKRQSTKRRKKKDA